MITEVPQEAVKLLADAAGNFTDTQLGAAVVVLLLLNIVQVLLRFKDMRSQIRFWRRKANDD